MKTFQDFLHLMDFNGVQTVQGPNESFSANCSRQTFELIKLKLCYLFIK